MNKNLIIVGCGWHAHVVAEIGELTGIYKEIKMLDRDWPEKKVWGDWQVVGGYSDLDSVMGSSSNEFIVSLGDNSQRLALCKTIVDKGGCLGTLVHPHAFVSPRAILQSGTVVCAGAVIQPYVVIGIGCILNTGSTIDHHSVLADGVHVSPGSHVSGNVCIGERTWLGTGVSVRDKIKIESDIIIGAGSVVVKNISEAGIYFGNPAKKHKSII